MKSRADEQTLAVLRATYQQQVPAVSLDLVERCYSVELEQIFEHERDNALAAIDRLVHAYVDSKLDGEK